MTRAVAILAVLPDYRASFVREVQRLAQERALDISLVAGDAHLDPTVRSAQHPGVTLVRNRALFGRRGLWQPGAVRLTRGADVVITDLNPRSLTAWLLLLAGRVRGQRTLVWGHILPRAGTAAKTVPLRRAMRRLAHGVISYTWADADVVRQEDRVASVWVAANGLYPDVQMRWDESSARHRLLYVGRLEAAKKPELALRAFAMVISELPEPVVLTLVGEGSEKARLVKLAEDLGVAARVEFLGHVADYSKLRDVYSTAVASLSPGYVGLSLTQSLGFGVPMLVADDEPHAPEVELLTTSTGEYFRADDATALGRAMVEALRGPANRWNRDAIVDVVRSRYSSSAMADGFCLAVEDRRQERLK